MATITNLSEDRLKCKCGCSRTYPLFRGWLEYGDDAATAFYITHFSHEEQEGNLWVLLGSGPWFEQDERGCWIVLQSWVAEGSVHAKAEDWANSPFLAEHIFEERFLTREEVLAKEGGLAWAIARREELIDLHDGSRTFLLSLAD